MASPVSRIPVCEPYLAGNELRYVTDAIQSGWISSAGDYLTRFEKQFSSACGVGHGIGVTNGTTALHLALVAAGIQPGDEVIMPDFTMIATAFAAMYCGAIPVFVDVDPETWTLDPKLIEEKITPKTRAVLVVHMYGHPADMDPIRELARRRGLLVIEDAAEAHGALYRGQPCGSLSDLATYSFFANKIVTTGEGGMVVTASAELAQRCRYFRNLCFPLNGPRSYVHEDVGFNYRMSNVQAAIGLAQLEKMGEYVDARRRNAQLYLSLLSQTPQLTLPVEKQWAKNVYWMFGVRISPLSPLSREDLMNRLKDDGIETRTFFQPMHDQPCFIKAGVRSQGSFPVSKSLARSGFYLPSGSGLTSNQIEYICSRLNHWLQ